MATLPIPVSVQAGGENRDYATIFADLMRLVPHLAPSWTYQGDDDFGVVLAQLVSYLGAHLHYRGDTIIRDLMPSTAIHLELVREQAEWLGYYARRKTPARVSLRLSISDVAAGDVVIAARSQFKGVKADGTQVIFENLAETRLPAGFIGVYFEAVEGRTVGPVVLGTATGEVFERFSIVDPETIFNWDAQDFQITVNGRTAQFFRWPIEMTDADLGYCVRQLRDGSLEVRFGDGAFGQRLPGGALVAITYRRGGGTVGNMARGAVNIAMSSFTANGVPISASVTNARRSNGGQEAETIDSVRVQAPAFFRSQNRLVTAEDYEERVMRVPGVFIAKAVASGINGVLINIVPEGAEVGDILTASLRRAILNEINPVRMLTHAVDVRQATLVPIDVKLECFCYANHRRSDVRKAIYAAFASAGGVLHFASGTLGKHLRLSDMVNVVEDVDGLDYVNVLRFTRRPLLRWVYRLGNGAFSAAGVAVTSVARDQVWQILFLDPTTFSVRGSVSGVQAELGTVGVPYTDAGREIAFTMEAGTVPFAEGDRGELTIGRLAWNVQLAANEFPVAGIIDLQMFGGIE